MSSAQPPDRKDESEADRMGGSSPSEEPGGQSAEAPAPDRGETNEPEEVGADPGYSRVHHFLFYSLSLPERTLRSASGLVGGALRESCSLLVPQAFQSSKTYTIFVEQMLDFMAEDIGGVEPDKDEDDSPKVENFVARKAVGNFIEMAGLATFHLSPMTLLAIVSDVAYGSQAYLKELGEQMKTQGVIDENSTINHVDDLLEAVADAAGTTASAFDTPPLSVQGLKQTIAETRKAAAGVDPTKVLPKAEVERLWNDMFDIAATQGVNPLAVSGAVTMYSLNKIGLLGRGALSTVTSAGTLFDRHVIDHYEDAVANIAKKGIYTCLAETSKPYIDAVWKNFSSDSTTITEDVLTGRTFGKAWKAVRRWLGGGQ
jgi:hypothetical protein